MVGGARAGVNAARPFWRMFISTTLDGERGADTHGGCAKGIPRNWCVSPFETPKKVPASSRTSGARDSRDGAGSWLPQLSSEFKVRLESCTVTCTVTEFTGEAREKRARVANKAKVTRLTSMIEKGFSAEGSLSSSCFTKAVLYTFWLRGVWP